MEAAHTAIALRPLEPEDSAITLTWRHNPEMMRMVVAPRRTITAEIEQRWIEQAIVDHREGRHLRFGIVRPDGRLIGAVHLTHIDRENRHCRTGIMIDPSEQGKGRGRQAYALALPIAFGELGMNGVRAYVLHYNTASQRLYTALGFQLEGRQRQAVYKDDAFHDLLMYSLLRDEPGATR